MIVEQRIYTTHPGKMGSWLPVFERDRLPILKRHLGEPLGFFTSDTGMLNQLICLWGYADASDRERRRAALWADPEWTDPASNTSAVLQMQESRILIPTRFSNIR